MIDQLAQVPCQDAPRILIGFMWLAAPSVRAKVGHDHSEAVRGNARRVAELDPVDLGIGEQTVEQNDRPTFAEVMIGELDSVGSRPLVNPAVGHPGKLPASSTHLSTSF